MGQRFESVNRIDINLDSARARRPHPEPGGWNRIHLIVEAIATDVQRLRAARLAFRNDIVSGPSV